MSDTFRTHDGRTLEQAASDLVAREVLCCMSSMVSMLAAGSNPCADSLADLVNQAIELAVPDLDYEAAAREAGWTDDGEGRRVKGDDVAEGWQDACDIDGIEAHETEVYEHWAVSQWLGEMLQAKGERVDDDFAGLVVWARTTTGQAISMDAVIQEITRELHIGNEI